MKGRHFIAVGILFSHIFGMGTCLAGDLVKGTYSVGASSNAVFQITDEEGHHNRHEFRTSVEAGYFLFDNFEIGTALTLSIYDEDEYKSHGYFIVPFIMYHLVLNDNSNIYFGLGAGLGRSEAEHEDFGDYDADKSLFYVEAGWEYFLTSNVALNLGFRAQQTYWNSSEFEDGSINSFGTELKFKLFF